MIKTSQQQFIDSVFGIRDLADPSKLGQFDASAISTDTTRVLAFPNASGTIALEEWVDDNFLALDGESSNVINGTFSFTTAGFGKFGGFVRVSGISPESAAILNMIVNESDSIDTRFGQPLADGAEITSIRSNLFIGPATPGKNIFIGIHNDLALTIDGATQNITIEKDLTLGGSLIIDDDGTIGSASDPDSITIDSTGNVVMSQKLTVTGLGTFGSLIIDDGGTIGSTNMPSAISIDDSGVVGIGAIRIDIDQIETINGETLFLQGDGGVSIFTADDGNINIAPDGTGIINLVADVDLDGTLTVDGNTQLDGTLTVSGISRLDGGIGIGTNPTANFPINIDPTSGLNGQITIRVQNDNSGANANTRLRVLNNQNTELYIGIFSSTFSTFTFLGQSLAGAGILTCAGDLMIGTSAVKNLFLGTNSLVAITIDGSVGATAQNITIEKDLTVNGNTILGTTTANTHHVNGAFFLPQVDGAADFLLKTNGSGQWGYVDEGTLDVATADAVAVVDAADTDATFYLGLWDAVSGDLEGKTDLALTFNPSTNALMIGGDVEITGDLVVSTTALVVDSTNDHVGLGALATPNAKLTIGGTEDVTADFNLIFGVSILDTLTNPNLNFAAINYAVEVRGDQAVDTITGVKTAINLTASFLGATVSEVCNFCVEENRFSATAKTGVVTIDNWYGYKMIVPFLALGTTINTAYGLFFPELDVATTNWQIFLEGGNSFFAGKNFYGQSDGTIGVYSQADSFLDLFADGAVRIGDSSSGSPTNYTQFTNGLQTMAGDARVIKHLHFTMELGKGQNTPTVRFTEDPYVSYTYGIGDDSHLSREAPDDMDYTVASIVKVHWYTTDATADGVDDVKWEVQWASQAVGEDITAGDTPDNSGDIVCSAANIIVETSIETVPANSIAANDMVGIHIQRVAVAGSDPAGNSVHVIDVELEYTSNKLGEAT